MPPSAPSYRKDSPLIFMLRNCRIN